MPIKDSITVGPQAFASAVGWVAKWVTARPVAPVHAGILLEVGPGALTVGAYGENASARATVELADPAPLPAEPQRAIVSGRLLADLAATFPAKPVVISGEGDDFVHIKVGRWSGTLPALPEQDYPTLPGALPTLGTVGGDAFADAARRVGEAAGKDVTKGPLFSGVHIEFTSDDLTLMATDRYRAAREILGWRPEEGARGGMPIEVVTLGSVFTDAAASFAGPDDITIGCDGRSLSLTSPSRSLTMQLLGGEYSVDTVRAWLGGQATYAARFTVNDDIVKALRRAALMRGKEGPVRLALSPGLITVAASETELRQEGGEEIDAEYDGEEIVIGFNPDYLADALASAPGDTVDMTFTDPRNPVYFTVPGNDTWRHLVGPVRILS
jgi:DNA polymerase III subunit beta